MFFEHLRAFFEAFNFVDITSIFIVMFAIIDINGSIPIILDMKDKGIKINPLNITLLSFAIFIIFLLLGEGMLKIFNVDLSSFAVAGSIVLFILGTEMTLDIEIFKYKGPPSTASIIPLVFPLIAGAGAITTLLTLRAEYAYINIIIALALNMVYVYFVVKYTKIIEHFFGKGTIYIMKKFFGIILLAMSIRLFMNNLTIMLHTINGSLSSAPAAKTSMISLPINLLLKDVWYLLM